MARPAHKIAGFTLIELLIALVVSSILATVMFQLFLGQGRFAQLQSAREEVQQNARIALDIMVSELRGVGEHAIFAATPHSIDFWAPRAWGLVCANPPPGDEIAVIFPSAALPSLASGSTDFLAVPPVGTSPSWQFVEVTESTSSRLSDATTWCQQLDPSYAGAATADESRARMFTDLPEEARGLTAGDQVYVYELVKYSVGTSAPGNELWIKRNTGPAGTMFPMAGPVAHAGAVSFTYFDRDGNQITVPSSQAELDAIRSIHVSVETRSRAAFSGTHQTETTSSVVYLRNRN